MTPSPTPGAIPYQQTQRRPRHGPSKIQRYLRRSVQSVFTKQSQPGRRSAGQRIFSEEPDASSRRAAPSIQPATIYSSGRDQNGWPGATGSADPARAKRTHRASQASKIETPRLFSRASMQTARSRYFRENPFRRPDRRENKENATKLVPI
jgi:hypothetical protein